MKHQKPGEFPFTRGIYPDMYKKRFWTMRQYAGYTSAEESNKRYRYLLDEGVTGLSVAFDLPTQIGYDSDHLMAEGEVGRVGVPISSIADMERLFNKIPLDKISTSMTINSTAIILLAMYIAVAENQGISPEKLRGTIQNDILKEYVARGTYIFPPKPSMRLITDIFDYCENNLPKWNTISISGYHIREAGSTAVQEIAFTLANGIAYVQSAIEAGLDANTFGERISFFFNTHNGFIEEISKFRAARFLWANIMKERFGVTNPQAQLCRFHTQTGGSTLTAQQIDNNVIRTTIQALAAVCGGTQSLHTNSKDEALSLPTDESVKLALRTQQLIAYESGVTNYPDPFGGSYVVEDLTNSLVQNAQQIIEQIDKMGGSVSAIENGWIQNEIVKSAYEYQNQVDNNEKIVIGVNKFVEDESVNPELLKIDIKATKNQVKLLKHFKNSRNNANVKTSLIQLSEAAHNTQNLFPQIINCVKNNCTLGEITDTLREIFGEYHQN
ncbi:MAG: methylmalonyl-CoA mutase family protein [Candidatus Neomarinimicrobiota bacterium]